MRVRVNTVGGGRETEMEDAAVTKVEEIDGDSTNLVATGDATGRHDDE